LNGDFMVIYGGLLVIEWWVFDDLLLISWWFLC